jgi:serine/threonine protein phosphatase PrpC
MTERGLRLKLFGSTLAAPIEERLGEASLALFAHAADPGGLNEDSLGVLQLGAEHLVLLLADGVGGSPVGEQASACALEQLFRTIPQAVSKHGDARQGILEGFDLANAAVMALGRGAATTLVVVEVHGHSLRSYHAGDSSVLVTGQRGKLKLSTIAHSPVGYAFEAGMLSERDALHHDKRHLVSNWIGSAELRIDIGPTLTLTRFDTLVMGSDGLFDNLATAEILELVRRGPLGGCASALGAEARRRMEQPRRGEPSKPDDLSFLLYRPRG